MLEFPRWKYALILVVLVISAIYALPNIYPQDPSVQVSSGAAGVSPDLRQKVLSTLAASHITPKDVVSDAKGRLLVRLHGADEQTRASDLIKPLLGDGETVALNLQSTVPGWLRAIGLVAGLLAAGGLLAIVSSTFGVARRR